MNCIIIEDEKHAIRHLENELAHTGFEVNVLARLHSIFDAVKWLGEHQADLIFLDVQLSDGISFEIFDHIRVRTPVIFTTSYDQYVTKAFDVNSISYLLKPVDADSLKLALQKFDFLYNPESTDEDLVEKMQALNTGYQKRFLVSMGSKLLSVPEEDVAYFKVENKRFVIMTTRVRQQYLIDTNLEMLEKRVSPDNFFRINRQYIVRIDAIREMQRIDNGRIRLTVEPPARDDMVVSGDRSSDFKAWLNR